MIIDSQLQSLPALSHVASDGSGIGGVDPKVYSAEVIPGRKQSLLLTTSGSTDPTSKGYPAWMWYPAAARPILPNTGNLRLSFRCTVGGNLSGLNTVETDVLIVQAGLMMNRSLQHVQSGKGAGFQIANQAGGWAATGLNPGPFVANQQYTLSFDNFFNGKDSSTTQIVQDGEQFLVPPNLQMIPSSPTSWPDGVYLQVQLGSMPNGLPWSLKLADMKLCWW
jgi:hypothetical protein